MASSITFKGRKNGLTIILNKDLSFEALKTEMKEKAAGSKKFFGAAVTAINFQGREISQTEEDELLRIFIGETGVTISEFKKTARSEPDTTRENAIADTARENAAADNTKKNTAAEKTREDILAETIRREPETESDGALFHKGSLRSGQAINYKGSVVVTGDVNPGGEIIAEGSVIVLGALKGMVHAGCGGDRSRFVFALKFAPTQLRIADTITYIPPEMFKKEMAVASYAYAEEGQIFIKQLLD